MEATAAGDGNGPYPHRIIDITERKRRGGTQEGSEELEQRVQERTAD